MEDKILFLLAEGKKPPVVVSGAGYVRDFSVETPNPAYEATHEEWESRLWPTGYFRLLEGRLEVGVGDDGRGRDK